MFFVSSSEIKVNIKNDKSSKKQIQTKLIARFELIGKGIANSYLKQEITKLIVRIESIVPKTPKSSGLYKREINGDVINKIN